MTWRFALKKPVKVIRGRSAEEHDEVIEGKPVLENVPPENRPINKYDWFQLSRSWLTGAEKRITGQVEGIQTTIKWFFGLGTSATILAVLFKDPKWTIFSLLIFVGSLALLLVSYAFSVFALTLVSRTVAEPNSDDCIREEFNRGNRLSKRYIIAASACLLLGMSFFPAAIMASYSVERKEKEVNAPSYFDAVAMIRTMNASGEKLLVGIDVSGYSQGKSVQFKLLKGSSFYSSVEVDSMKHRLRHQNFDVVLPTTRPLPIEKTKYFLTMYYADSAHSVHGKTVEVTFEN